MHYMTKEKRDALREIYRKAETVQNLTARTAIDGILRECIAEMKRLGLQPPRHDAYIRLPSRLRDGAKVLYTFIYNRPEEWYTEDFKQMRIRRKLAESRNVIRNLP